MCFISSSKMLHTYKGSLNSWTNLNNKCVFFLFLLFCYVFFLQQPSISPHRHPFVFYRHLFELDKKLPDAKALVWKRKRIRKLNDGTLWMHFCIHLKHSSKFVKNIMCFLFVYVMHARASKLQPILSQTFYYWKPQSY